VDTKQLVELGIRVVVPPKPETVAAGEKKSEKQ